MTAPRKTHLLAAALVGALALAAAPAAAQTFPCVAGGGTNCTSLIPDANGGPVNTTPGVLTSTITIPAGTCGALGLSHVSFGVNLIHDFIGDLRVRVTSPTAATFTLTDRPGLPAFQPGGCQNDDINTTFLDGGAASVPCNASIPASGTAPIAPVNLLGGLAGTSPVGAWTLEITDFSNSGTGALQDWSVIAICGGAPVVTIAATVPIAYEAPVTNGTFTVTRSIVTPSPLTVNLTYGGTATAADYVGVLPATVTIPANQASVTFNVVPVADVFADSGETVVATVAPGTGYAIGSPSSATVTIFDALATGIPTLSEIGLAALTLALALAAALVLRLRAGAA